MSKDDITNKDIVPDKVEKALAKMGKDDLVALVDLPKTTEIEKILAAYPEEVREDIKLSRKQVTSLLKHSKISTFGVNNTLPMLCHGEECPVYKTCFFYKAGIAPKGERCPDEIMYLDQMIPQLITDMGVDLENYLEVSMVQEYAAALLDKRRAQNMIALYGDVKEVATSVIQATGTALYTEQATPYVDIKARSSKLLTQLRKELLATREQRAKYKLTDETDPSTRAAEMREKFEKLVEIEQEEKKITEQSLDEAFKEDVKNDS